MSKLILAIDTSCDETSAAVVAGQRVLSNVISSQAKLHNQYGGVMPTLAKLEHAKRIDAVIALALKRAKVKLSQVDAIAVTQGPGLAIALEVGINAAKKLSLETKKPLIAVNHMEGHLLSPLASTPKAKKLDISALNNSIALLISGKHSEIVKVNKIGEYKLLGETLDDACGEAFDKAARLIGLGYPGAKALVELAKEYRNPIVMTKRNGSALVATQDPKYGELALPIPMYYSKDLDMSFSGLKTAFWQLVGRISNEQKFKESAALPKDLITALSALFESAIVETLGCKIDKALAEHKPRYLLLGGGVVNNLNIRKKLRSVAKLHNAKLAFAYTSKLFTDNAAMIGIAAYYKLQRGEVVKDSIDRKPNWNIF